LDTDEPMEMILSGVHVGNKGGSVVTRKASERPGS
jgi:hypothetical protein